MRARVREQSPLRARKMVTGTMRGWGSVTSLVEAYTSLVFMWPCLNFTSQLNVSKARGCPNTLLLTHDLWLILPLLVPEQIVVGVLASLHKAQPAIRYIICCYHRKPSDVLARQDRWSCVDLLLFSSSSSFWQIRTMECEYIPSQAPFCSGSLEHASECYRMETLGCW